MKRILSLVLTLASLLTLTTFCVGAGDDGLVLQDIEYEEVIGRVNQMDSGFTISSTYIYTRSRTGNEAPLDDYGYQFYYIGLERWSTDAGGKDGPIDQWFLDWLDTSLQNLRENGANCMIRGTYALDGHEQREPQTFEQLLEHQVQLAEVFSKYPDVVSSVECGMIGAFGEMWGGKYSRSVYKAQVLDTWLKNLPDEISVNVRTSTEYTFYVTESEPFKSTYAKQTIDGVRYPPRVHEGNYHTLPFEDTDYARIGCYNDAMIQDFNDGGSFSGSRDSFVRWLNMRGTTTAYGGEFSGAAGKYRYEADTWQPMFAIPEFYEAHLSYYHGGNNAYKYTGNYHTTYTSEGWYDSASEAESAMKSFHKDFEAYGCGMTHEAAQNLWRVLYNVPSGTNDNGEVIYTTTAEPAGTLEQAEEKVASYTPTVAGSSARVQYGVSYTTGGWSSAKYNNDLILAIREALYEASDYDNEENRTYPTADLDDYKGESVADFFEDHIGYRFVLRESYLSESVAAGGVLTVKGAVDNVGFANVIRNKVTEIILTDGENTYVVKTDIDVKDWVSAQRSEYNVQLKLPASIPAGDYEVYIRSAGQASDGTTNEENCIRFCNSGQFSYQTLASTYSVGSEVVSIIYNSDVCGNYLGEFTVTEGSIPGSDDSFRQVVTDFNDVPAGKWYEDAVKSICGIGLMNGVGGGAFDPEGTTTRGQFVTVLYNMEGKPDVDDVSTPFNDVAAGRYYTDPVSWAYENEIVNGTSDTTFSPDAKLTREQFATMLCRYAEYKGVDVSARADLSAYEDEADVSTYAKETMSWANAKGFITGVTTTTLVPKGYATRAQMATILMRYINDVSAAK